jgi:Sulfatase
MNYKRFAFIPLIIVVYYFFHYTTDFFYFLDPSKAMVTFIKYLLICYGIFFAGMLFFKNKERFTLAFCSILFIFLFFGSITDTAVAIHILKPFAAVDIKMAGSFLAVCMAFILISIRINKNVIEKLLNFWIIYCLAVLFYDAARFAFSAHNEKIPLSMLSNPAQFKSEDKPPVFFLLYDMYPSDSVLNKYLNFDNTALHSFLKEKEFFVSGNAHSLYQETYYSLASTLSLAPLDYLQDGSIKEYKKKIIALKNIEHSNLPGIFQQSGYVFNNYSVFNLQGQPSPLQFNLNYHLDNILTSTTFYNRLYDGFETDFFLASRNINLGFIKKSWSAQLKKDLATLNTDFALLMDSFATTQKPSFNYFHFMIPHPPMLYDSSGHENTVKDMYTYNGFDKTINNYTQYIKFTNSTMQKMVNEIFERAGKNVIIIIQGDHGYREFNERFPDEVRYGILNAVYLPNKNHRSFNDTMTPIHTFKQVLKNQFGFDYVE